MRKHCLALLLLGSLFGGSILTWTKTHPGKCPFAAFKHWLHGGKAPEEHDHYTYHHHGHHEEKWAELRECHEKCPHGDWKCHHACPKPWSGLEKKCAEHKTIKTCHEKCPHHDFVCHMQCPWPAKIKEHPLEFAGKLFSEKMRKHVGCHLSCGEDKACHEACPKAWCQKLEEKCNAFEEVHTCHEKCGCPFMHPEAKACHQQCPKMPEDLMGEWKHHHHHHGLESEHDEHDRVMWEKVHDCHEKCGWDTECHYGCPRMPGHHGHVLQEFAHKLTSMIV